MPKTIPTLHITYSDYHYLINLFDGEFDDDEIMNQTNIDYILNFAQTSTTTDFFKEIIQHSAIFIPTNTKLKNAIDYLQTLNNELILPETKQAVQKVIAKLTHIQQTPINKRNVYFRADFEFKKHINVSHEPHQFQMTDLQLVTYAEFMDNLTNIPMELLIQRHAERA